jgi:hypothetical protein
MVKLRWRIERDYHDLKQEVGLGHFEGRSRRGFHHHAILCIAAYGFRSSPHQIVQGSYHSLKLSAEGIRHCGLNGTFQIRLRPFEKD